MDITGFSGKLYVLIHSKSIKKIYWNSNIKFLCYLNSDPYVKVSLMCQDKRIKKKKSTVKKSTLNPVYNEALVFDVPAESIEDVNLIVKVVDYDR